MLRLNCPYLLLISPSLQPWEGCVPCLWHFQSIFNYLFSFKAESGNRVFQGVEGEDPFFTSNDGDISTSFRDLDTGLQIMKPDAFTAVDGCILRPNWKMAMCSQKYAKVWYENAIVITKTRLYNFDPLKPHFFYSKTGGIY